MFKSCRYLDQDNNNQIFIYEITDDDFTIVKESKPMDLIQETFKYLLRAPICWNSAFVPIFYELYKNNNLIKNYGKYLSKDQIEYNNYKNSIYNFKNDLIIFNTIDPEFKSKFEKDLIENFQKLLILT